LLHWSNRDYEAVESADFYFFVFCAVIIIFAGLVLVWFWFDLFWFWFFCQIGQWLAALPPQTPN